MWQALWPSCIHFSGVQLWTVLCTLPSKTSSSQPTALSLVLCDKGTTQNVSGCSWSNGFQLAISICLSFIGSILSYPQLFPWYYVCFTHLYHLVMNFHKLWQLQTQTLDHVFSSSAIFKLIVMVMWHVCSVLLWLCDDGDDLLLPITKWKSMVRWCCFMWDLVFWNTIVQ